MLVGTGRHHYPADHAFDRQGDLACFTLELTYSGAMLRRCGRRRRLRVQPNDTLLLTPPGTAYSLRGQRPGIEIWLVFTPRHEFEDCLRWPVGSFGIPELRLPPSPLGRQITQAFEEAHQVMTSRLPRRQLLAENALERLLLLAARLRDEAAPARAEGIQRAVSAIHERFASPLSIAALATAAGLSASRFAHLFRQQTGVSPMRYLEGVRLEQAQAHLLRTDLPIKEIAALVGFDSAFYFSTRFRRRFGCPPRAWRRHPAPPAAESPRRVAAMAPAR
ncbi:MAG: helix-turn-helix transcriptional regulator [Lentisphaerae bacterium]|nr:helix-turn-helix transcriptional regulator [Lentisphaerota bacterium]